MKDYIKKNFVALGIGFAAGVVCCIAIHTVSAIIEAIFLIFKK